MKKSKHRLMLSCLKATEMIERKIHFRLSFMGRLQLRMHEMMCDACTLYDKQSSIIEQSISHQIDADQENLDTEDLQHQILDKLAQTDKKN